MNNPFVLHSGRIKPLLAGLWKGTDTASTAIRAMAASMFILGLNMLTGILTANYLGADGRGAHAAIILWPQFLAFVLTFGLHSAVLYNMKKYPSEAARLYVSSLLLSLAAGAVACVIGYCFIPLWLDEFSPQIIAFSQWSLLAAPLLLLSFVNNAVMRARDEFTLFNRVRYAVPLATLAILLGCALSGTLTPYTSAIAYLGPFLPTVIWSTLRLLRIYRPRLRELRDAIRWNLHYGIRSYGIDLLGNMSLYIDQIIVVRLLPPAALGLYVVAVSLSRMANIFTTSLSYILFPKTSGLPQEEVIAMTVRVFRISTFVSLLAAIAAMAIAPYILVQLYGPDFGAAVSVFRVLVLDVIVMGACIVLSQAFMSLGRPGLVTGMYGAGLAFTVPLLYWLVPVHGVVGAGMAMLLSSLVRLVFILLQFPLALKAPFPRMISFAEDTRWLKQALLRRSKREAGQ